MWGRPLIHFTLRWTRDRSFYNVLTRTLVHLFLTTFLIIFSPITQILMYILFLNFNCNNLVLKMLNWGGCFLYKIDLELKDIYIALFSSSLLIFLIKKKRNIYIYTKLSFILNCFYNLNKIALHTKKMT